MNGTESLTLQQLADATGIEPRTIRSYIERGILPGPDSRGRHSVYPRETLDRLRVLSLLRDARRDISLDQIRMLLSQLSPSQVRGIAEGEIRIGGLIGAAELESSIAPPGGSRTAALEYLKQIRQASARPSPGRSRGASAFAAAPSAPPDATDHLTPLDQLAAALSTLVPAGTASRPVRSETWHRLAITHDIELAIRGEFSAEQIAQLHRIGDTLRLLLTKGVSR